MITKMEMDKGSRFGNYRLDAWFLAIKYMKNPTINDLSAICLDIILHHNGSTTNNYSIRIAR